MNRWRLLSYIYGPWGFVNGFAGTSHYINYNIDKDKGIYYTDRLSYGLLNAPIYIATAPVSTVLDIRNIEDYVRNLH